MTTTSTSITHWRSEASDAEVETDELAFRFLGGRPSLDLVATIGERWRRGHERLRTPNDLARWCVEAGLVTRPPDVDAADLRAARRLRGAIARTAMAWGTGAPLDPADVEVVNAAAAAPDLAPTLAPDGTRAPAVASDVRAVLSLVARDAIALVAEGDPSRLRECAADDCALLFEDASRPGSRRWCSMAACGNRSKVARHRRRGP